MSNESDQELAAAERAPLTGQVRGFLAWLGDGRRLTQTGRIGLIDARHLVESLGTGDELDPKIGDRVFKTQTSEELSGLMRVVGWSKAARLVRVTGSRLVPVRKNAAVADEPLRRGRPVREPRLVQGHGGTHRPGPVRDPPPHGG